MNKIEQFIEKLINDLIHKWIDSNWLRDLSHPQVYIMAKGIETIINSAVSDYLQEKLNNSDAGSLEYKIIKEMLEEK